MNPDEPSTGVAVEADSIGKCYRVFPSPRARLLQGVLGGRRQLYREFWALRNVSFQLARGQTLGVVGRNGSGKSTLLQLLCRTLTPTTGEIRVHGRVGALLELGSGFNPEFSGRENVFLNATVLGLSQRQIEARLDDILAFADIGSFIDQPVKTYSSGMVVRLAFAVQAHIDPDILVVDEALAVGDEMFQKKCYAHLERLKERGTSILLVTHSCPQIIQHCDQALLLHKGIARMLAEPARVTVTYQRLINASDAEWETAFGDADAEAARPSVDPIQPESATGPSAANQETAEQAWLDRELRPESTEIYPEHGARILDARITDMEGNVVNVIPFNQDFSITFDYEAQQDLSQVMLACHIASHTGQRISGQSLRLYKSNKSGHASPQDDPIPAGTRWSCGFSFRGGLWPGLYFIGGGIIQENDNGRTFIHRVVDFRALKVLDSTEANVIGACDLSLQPPSFRPLSAAQPGAGT